LRERRRRRSRSVHSDCMGCAIEPRNALIAGAEAVGKVERNMSSAAKRGAVALPGSENTSRAKGTRRNLGDLISPAIAQAVPGHGRKPRRQSCRGRGEESDGCIVPVKRRTMLSGQQQRRWWREGRPVEGKVRGDACPGHCAGSGMSQKQRACASELHGLPSPECRLRSTFDKSPVRKAARRDPCGGGE